MHKIKADSLQVNSVESKEELLIAIQTILRYAEALVPVNDYDLVPKWYVDTRGITVEYLDETTPYYSSGSGGSITIPDFDADYPTLSANGIVRMQGYITVNGTQVEVDIIPVVTRDSGAITSATFNFAFDPADTITTFKLRMY